MKVKLDFAKTTKRTFVFTANDPNAIVTSLYVGKHAFAAGHEPPQPPATILVEITPVGTAVAADDPLAGV